MVKAQQTYFGITSLRLLSRAYPLPMSGLWTLNSGLGAQERMELLAGARFNSCLLNLYRDGRDAMGWHSDNEALYGQTPTIGALAAALPGNTYCIAFF